MSAIDACRNEYLGFQIWQLVQYKESGPQYIIKSFKNLTNFEYFLSVGVNRKTFYYIKIPISQISQNHQFLQSHILKLYHSMRYAINLCIYS